MPRLSIRYHTPAELLADHDQQMAKGGVLCRGVIPPSLALYQPVQLEIAADFGELSDKPELISGQVVQIVAGAGVAVAFAITPRLTEAVQAARATSAVAVVAGPASRPSTAEKIQRALHGTKDERGAILRDTNRMLHPYVLKNPNLGIDEVLAIAKMRTVSPDVLSQICERREWVQRADIAIALVRNPITPVGVAVKLLEHVTQLDLRQLAKDSHTRQPIQQAARKRVIG